MRFTKVLFLFCAAHLEAQTTSDEFGNQLFETKIRPVLVNKCFACHSSKLKAPMGGLALDLRSGLRKGGASGPEVVPGKPEESRLIKALTYTDAHLRMPPSGKLDAATLGDFQAWVKAGAPDPRVDPATNSHPRAMTLEEGRKWWAFQQLQESAAPEIHDRKWPRTQIDSFILAKLEQRRLAPSPESDRRTLIRRSSLDLVGMAPTYAEVEAFTHNPAPDAYERLLDRLLASPHYGERWARYWLDVARYGEDNPRNGPTNPTYPFAWRYRDWVIQAFNRDLPYREFVELQLAADQMPEVPRDDWRALGFLGIGPVAHKDGRLSKEVLETFAADDWDERADLVSRGILGLTVSCARCHDHKFDPISTRDYYSLAGVFASSAQVQRPLFEVDPQTEAKFVELQLRLHNLNANANLLTGEPGTDREGSAHKVAAFRAEIQSIQQEVEQIGQRYPQLADALRKITAKARAKRGDPDSSQEPFYNGVYDAGLWLDGSDPALTLLDYRLGQARDLTVFIHGNTAMPGEVAPRGFPAVLTKGPDASFHQGSGRLELSRRIFSDAAPLAARVIVNRVWAWHFGRALVATQSDLGTQGDKPTHPELLDDLAARFVSHGWSLKWLHREIMLSAAYRQSSRPLKDSEKADPSNALLWRMNPRRLDIEAFRDSILRADGKLDEALYGPPVDLDSAADVRRTIYSKVSRENMNTILRLYDVPDPAQHSPSRDLTTTPLQQLFVLNSSFIQQQAAALAASVEGEPAGKEKIRSLYRRIFARDPDAGETDLALSYLQQGTVAAYAQALIETNEFIFWP